MAGLFFWHKTQFYQPEEVNRIFVGLDYKHGKLLKLGDWNAVVFPKSSYKLQNWMTFIDGAICGIGTFAYKGKVYNEALPLIANDIRENKLQTDAFWGSFLILAHFGEKHVLIRDGAGFARLHGLDNKPVYSSSFVGLLRCSPIKLNLNKEAIIELLSTGLVSGKETIVKEIEHVNLSYELKLIDQVLTTVKKTPKPKTREEALNQQIETARAFFKRVSTDWFKFMPNSVFDHSITGGLDSRLVAAFVLEQHKKVKFHTHWSHENSGDTDFPLAKNVASHLNLPIFFKEVKTADQKNDLELEQTFRDSHNSCDGVIRPGSFWDEELTTAKYRLELTPLPYIRISGYGGEQYRNMERLPLKSSRSYRDWVRWEIIYRFAGYNFTNKKELRHLEDRIVENFEQLLGKDSLNLLTFKEYRRQVIEISYRSLQTNTENRYGFLLSPLADTNLSLTARSAYPFLGKSLQFQIDMIKRVAPDLASLPNSHGFDLLKGEPRKQRLGVDVWQIMPSSIKYRMYNFYKRKQYKSDFIEQLENKSQFIKTILENIHSIGLPIDLKRITQRNSRGKLVMNLGYFLKVNKDWLNL